jgi:putative transposase
MEMRMPKRAGMYLSGMPHHIFQRANNHDACFYRDEDYQVYLQLLEECSCRYDVKIHAYTLMKNHYHLLVTPKYPDSISRMMKAQGSRYAFYINKRHKKSGPVWEQRYRSSVLDESTYLLKCYRYIELIPVRASMVEMPEEYRWSSYGVNAWSNNTQWLEPHVVYQKLGRSKQERCCAYRKLFKSPLEQCDIQCIRRAIFYSHPLGDSQFVEKVEKWVGSSMAYFGGRRNKALKH